MLYRNIYYICIIIQVNEMSKTAYIPIKIEPSVKAKLQKMADDDSRTLSDFIRLHLMRLVEKPKKK